MTVPRYTEQQEVLLCRFTIGLDTRRVVSRLSPELVYPDQGRTKRGSFASGRRSSRRAAHWPSGTGRSCHRKAR